MTNEHHQRRIQQLTDSRANIAMQIKRHTSEIENATKITNYATARIKELREADKLFEGQLYLLTEEA